MEIKKKILIILAAIVVIGIGIVLYFVFSDRNNSATAPTDESANGYGFSTSFDSSGQITRYNSKSNQIEIYNQDTGEFDPVADIDKPADYAEVSSDGTRALYTIYPEDSNDELQTLYSFDIDGPSDVATTEKVFSPHFLPNGSIIYQSFPSTDSSQLNIMADTGKTTKVTLPVSNEQEIKVINANTVVIYDYSTDVSEITSYLVDLATGKNTKLAQGNGLQIKTVANSQYIGIQTLADDETSSVKILTWQDEKEVVTLEGISLGDIDWGASEDNYYFAKSGKLIRGSFIGGQNKNLENVPNPVSMIKILKNGKIYISSPDEEAYTVSI